MNIFLLSTSDGRLNPSDSTLRLISSPVSSKVIKTPGSPNSVAPRTRNSMANMVFPQPGPPHTMVGRPAGRPPPLISSKPAIPLGAFFSCGKARVAAALVRFDARAIAVFWASQSEVNVCVQSDLCSENLLSTENNAITIVVYGVENYRPGRGWAKHRG